jgi:two-component system nitrate/nitrite response regulator NarL
VAISIILADDHPVVHRGIHAVLERERDFSIVGVAADGLETVRFTERLKPDVLVLDLMMPGLSGLEALRILRERSPRKPGP